MQGSQRALRRRSACLSRVPHPALAAPKPNLMTHALYTIATELVPINRAVSPKYAALVELISLLHLHICLALRSTGILCIPNPAVAAELVADRDLARVGVAEALVLGCAVAAELGALVELVALVEERVGRGEGES